MTLNEQLTAAELHREAESQNYDLQIKMVQDHSREHLEFINSQKSLSLAQHDKAITVIKAQIEAHKAFIGDKVA